MSVTLERAEKLAWTLLAVELFGHYGTDRTAGSTLIQAGLIESSAQEDVFQLTPKGQTLARRIRESRR